ncbi:MAG: thioesterase [Gemmatales bacterium]|nr:MAG: thioesterase [Gemmatales bacterium]
MSQLKPFVNEILREFPVVIELPVVWGEMDAYKHVNNVVYFRYFESARLEYFRRLDWFRFEEQTGIGPILAATQCRFRRPLTYPDTISVGARVIDIADDRFTLQHKIVSHRLETLTTEGTGTVVTFHYPSQQKVPIPAEIRARISQLQGV